MFIKTEICQSHVLFCCTSMNVFCELQIGVVMSKAGQTSWDTGKGGNGNEGIWKKKIIRLLMSSIINGTYMYMYYYIITIRY